MPSAFNERGPLHMEQALNAIHQGLGHHKQLTLSLVRSGPSVQFVCQVPDELTALVEGQLLAQYPESRIERPADQVVSPPQNEAVWTVELSLRPEILPIHRYAELADPTTREPADPLTGILAALAGSPHDPLQCRVDLIARPAKERQIRRAHWALRQVNRPLFYRHRRLLEVFAQAAVSRHWWTRLAARWLIVLVSSVANHEPEPAPASRSHDREQSLQGAHDKLHRRLFQVQLRIILAGPATAETRAVRKLQEVLGAIGQLGAPDLALFHGTRIRRTARLPRLRTRGFLLSAEELATLWHLPTFLLRPQAVEFATYRQLEPPASIPTPDQEPEVAVLGRTAFRKRRERFGLRTDDRRRHLYIVGKTGMGKSTLLLNLISADLRANHGCALIDPHGDLAETVLAGVPSHRTNEVVLFDAGDQTNPIAFNPLADCDPAARPLVVSGMLSAFKKLYGDSWGPRLEHIFRNCLLALLETPGASLVSLVQLLGDAHYRQSVIARVADPVVRSFWLNEFAAMPAKLQAEAIAPVQNKVGHFVSSPLLRHIIGQSRSTIDLRRIMDAGQVLIVNLSKGRMGEDASSLLGSLVITTLQLAAMSRADVPEADRRDFYLYVDEFQNFATESFAGILSEARKYRLALTLANQYLDQMEEATANAVFGNCGSMVVFQVGERDSETLSAQLGHDVAPQDVLALPRYEAYVRLLADGLPTRPFSMCTLPPSTNYDDPLRAEIIRRASRRRYGRPISSVADEIERAFARH